MKQKGKSSFQRLMGYAGKRKYLTYLSLALAVVSAVIALIPFYEIWRIIKEVLKSGRISARRYISKHTAGMQ